MTPETIEMARPAEKRDESEEPPTSGSGHGTSGGTGHGTSSSSISSSSTSTLSGLTASSLVTAAMGKQNMIYDNYGSTNNPSQSSSKPRSSVRDIR